MKALILIFLILLMSYLFGAFVAADWDFVNWNPFARFFLAVNAVILIATIMVEYLLHEGGKPCKK
jgi:hypothetical protein